MGTITFILLTKQRKKISYGSIKVIPCNGKNLLSILHKVHTKYVAFMRDVDMVDEHYFEKIYEKIEEDFDCCFLNYDILYKYRDSKEHKINHNEKELAKNIPFVFDTIWSYIFRTKKLIKTLELPYSPSLNDSIAKIFRKRSSIGDVIYYHRPVCAYLSRDKNYYIDVKNQHYYKNILYIADGCNCVFNGYVSWVLNISRCFGKQYDITLLYDEIWEPTLKMLENYFHCVKRNYYDNYVCDRLLCTYSHIYYPKNIFYLEKNFLFIHGLMEDFSDSYDIFYDDIYSEYIAVSDIARKKSQKFFPFTTVKAILNPFQLDPQFVKPHLRLVSAQRYDSCKRFDRIEKLAACFDELDIPYTWNVFTDYQENTNHNGLIYRSRIYNVYPYVEDSDYFVLLSDTEAMPYSMIEALSLQTKVIGTPLDAFYELGVKDGENGFIIPFEAFEDDNHSTLLEYAKKIYENKGKEISYHYTDSFYAPYEEIFKK